MNCECVKTAYLGYFVLLKPFQYRLKFRHGLERVKIVITISSKDKTHFGCLAQPLHSLSITTVDCVSDCEVVHEPRMIGSQLSRFHHMFEKSGVVFLLICLLRERFVVSTIFLRIGLS